MFMFFNNCIYHVCHGIYNSRCGIRVGPAIMIDAKAARQGQFTGNLKLILNGLTRRPGGCRLAGRDDDDRLGK